jgi:polar amino acid transport system permease protein
MPVFDFSLLLRGQYHDMLLAGLALSLQLAAVTLVLALPLALSVALMRLSPVAFLRWAGFAFVESIRNIPLLAHMLFWYFGAPELLPEGLKTWLYAGNIEAVSAVIALTFYTAAFMAEDIRSGIRAIPPVQFEAGRALGFSFLAMMRRVVLPQALRITVPPLISQTLNLWKNTSIATVIGAAELMYQAGQVESATFRSFESFGFATAAYLSVSLLITGLAAWYQHRWPARHV